MVITLHTGKTRHTHGTWDNMETNVRGKAELFSTPPRAQIHLSSSCPHIHNYVAHGKECLMSQWLGKEIG